MLIYLLMGEGEEQVDNDTREMPSASLAISPNNLSGSHNL